MSTGGGAPPQLYELSVSGRVLDRVQDLAAVAARRGDAAAFLAANESYNGCTISIMGSEYRELESGVERHKRDIMGDDPRFRMNAEQQRIMGEAHLNFLFIVPSYLRRTEGIFPPASKW